MLAISIYPFNQRIWGIKNPVGMHMGSMKYLITSLKVFKHKVLKWVIKPVNKLIKSSVAVMKTDEAVAWQKTAARVN